MPEIIGSVAVEVGGDTSKLVSDLQTARSMAKEAGAEIASAFDSGAVGQADDLDRVVADLRAQFAALKPPVDETGKSVADAGQRGEEAGKKLHDAGEHAKGAGHGFHELKERAWELAGELGLVIGFAEALKETVSAWAGFQMAQVSLEALLGSTEAAADAMERLKDIAEKEIIDMPELVPAAQRMIAMGFAVDDVIEAMKAADNVSQVMGESFEATSSAISNMALSGMAGSRQLKGLGLSADELAASMGVTKDQVQAVFAAMSEHDRVTALTAALQKFGDVGRHEAETLAGQWTLTKNALHELMIEVGEIIGPPLTAITKFVAESVKQLGSFIKAARESKTAWLEMANTPFAMAAGAAMSMVAGPAIEPPKAPNAPGVDFAAMVEEMKRHAAAAAAALKGQTTELERLKAALAEVTEAHRLGLATSYQVKDAQEAVTAAYQRAHPELQKTWTQAERGATAMRLLAEQTAAFDERKMLAFEVLNWQLEQGNLELPEMTANVQQFRAGMDSAMAVVNQAVAPVYALDEAFKRLGITIRDDHTVATKSIADFELVANAASTSGAVVQAAWAAASRDVRRLAEADLPQAVRVWGEYIEALERKGAAQGTILLAMRDEIAMEAELKTQRGESSNAELIRLANLNNALDVMRNRTQALGLLYQDLMHDFRNAFTTLGSGLAQAIVQTGRIGTAFAVAGRAIAQSILTTVVNGALRVLGDTLIHLSTQVLGQWLGRWVAVHIGARAASTSAAAASTKVWTASAVATTAAWTAAATAITTAMTTAAFTSATAWSAVDVAEVMSLAAVAAAATFASIAAIPIVGPGLAPEAAAASYEAVSAFAPLASFDKGGWIPRDMIAQVHAGEYVVPANQTSNIGGTVNASITISGSRSPAETAREVVRYLKMQSPVFSPFSR